jgi:hypothetical protein
LFQFIVDIFVTPFIRRVCVIVYIDFIPSHKQILLTSNPKAITVRIKQSYSFYYTVTCSEIHDEHIQQSINSTPIKFNFNGSRDNAAGIATGYGLDCREIKVRAPVGSRIFSTSSRPVLWPIQPPFQWVPESFTLRVKRPGREADHSPPTSAEVKKT